MKTLSLQLGNLLSQVLLAAVACGCATPALWKSTARREWRPVAPDHVVLITDTNHQHAVVVLFGQIAAVGKTNTFRNVGWRVGQSPRELALTPRAINQHTNSCGEFGSVPLFLAGGVPANASSQSPGYAIWNSMDQQLTVYLSRFIWTDTRAAPTFYRPRKPSVAPRCAFSGCLSLSPRTRQWSSFSWVCQGLGVRCVQDVELNCGRSNETISYE